MSDAIGKLRDRAEHYFGDDANGDLDHEKWGEAMPPGDVCWLLGQLATCQRERDEARAAAAIQAELRGTDAARWAAERDALRGEVERLRELIAQAKEAHGDPLAVAVLDLVRNETAEAIAAWLEGEQAKYKAQWYANTGEPLGAVALAAHDATGQLAADIRSGSWRKEGK